MRYLSVTAWLEATPRPPCLDVREEGEFRRGHLPGAGNLPLPELPRRMHELPDRGAELYVVGGTSAEAAARQLATRDRWTLAWSDEEPRGWPAAKLQSGLPRALWRPNAWLEEHWRRIPAGGRVLDAAMGSGRNAVFLARQGLRVEGVDILPEAVALAGELAARHGVRLTLRCDDLRNAGGWEEAAYAGVVVIDFLDRELLPRLSGLLAPGGVMIYETFTAEQARRVGRPRKAQWLLEPRELLESFPELEILASREGAAGRERFVASLVARRPIND